VGERGDKEAEEMIKKRRRGETCEEAEDKGAGQLLTWLGCHLTLSRGRLVNSFSSTFLAGFSVLMICKQTNKQTNIQKNAKPKRKLKNAQRKVKSCNNNSKKLDRKYAQYTKTEWRKNGGGQNGESERKLKKSTEYFARDLRQWKMKTRGTKWG